MLIPRRTAVFPLLFGIGVVALFFGHLLRFDLALAGRDYAFLHLPFRTTLHELARTGSLWWNPFIHGGQPILSNPHYAALYPPTWLALVLPPHYALNILVVLHGGWAFAGAWRLTRVQGGSTGAAAIAASGYLAGGAFLSLAELFNLFCGMAWFPWVVLTGQKVITEQGNWKRHALLCGGTWGLQLLNGEPASVMMSGLALGAIWATNTNRPRNLARLAVPFALCLLVACAQLVPTLNQIRDSPRVDGLSPSDATAWSTTPARLVELLSPHLFGDPSRIEEGLFFGSSQHDKGYPLVLSLYPGLLILLLAAAGAFGASSRVRNAWCLAILFGLVLAFGHHNPLSAWLWSTMPILKWQRFPEKLICLAAVSLPFLAATGWDRLLSQRDSRHAGAARLMLNTSIGVLAVALGVTAASFLRVDLFAPVLQGVSGPPEQTEVALTFIRSEALIRVFLGLLVVGFFLLLRKQNGASRRGLLACALALLLADLWYSGHRLNPTVPARLLTEPPPLAQQLQGSDHRVFAPTPSGSVGLSFAEPGQRQLDLMLGRLEPVSGSIWGLSYAFNPDYDLTLTGWGRHAQRLIDDYPSFSQRLLGAWNVGAEVVPRSNAEIYQERRATGGNPVPARLVANPELRPRIRFSERAQAFPSLASALQAAARDGFEGDHLVTAHDTQPETGPAATLEAVLDRGARIGIDYTATSRSVLILAVTFDSGWSATIDGQPLPVVPTALGQIAVIVPSGTNRVNVAYRDPWVIIGIALSLITILGMTAAWHRLPSRSTPSGLTNGEQIP